MRLKAHRESCPRNATCESYATVVDLLACISTVSEKNLLTSFKSSPYFSLMADEATDISSNEELSVFARWLENNKPVEHFLSIVHGKEVTAKGIASNIYIFLESKCIDLQECVGLGLMGQVQCQATGQVSRLVYVYIHPVLYMYIAGVISFNWLH